MTESFLHYLWQFQYFAKTELKTTADESVVVLKPGMLNADAGPDFLQAKIKIGAMEWVGSVEIHLQSSGWYEHKHDQDSAYENVVLHVVWEENKPVYRKDGTRMPTLQLKGRVEDHLLKSYQRLVNDPASVPCNRVFGKVDETIKHSMIDKATLQRLERKGRIVLDLLKKNRGDWEETTYQLLAANFGFKVNKDSFQQLARILSYKLILKHKSNPKQVEAMLFGMGGFLVAKSKDEYVSQLVNEFNFLAKKYSLQSMEMNVTQWKFLRLRPANFPTLRIAQLAALLSSQPSIFSAIINAPNAKSIAEIFEFNTSPYWASHYRFGKKSKQKISDFGADSRENVIINSVVPILVAYGQTLDDWSYIERAESILQTIPSEKNKITRMWLGLGYTSKNAFDSQGLIELYTNFCQKRACLNCNIGSTILKPIQA